MHITSQKNAGELRINLEQADAGRLTFSEMGLKVADLSVEGGHERIVLELGPMQDEHLFRMPTIEIGYTENVGESAWQVDFNGETVLDKKDHSGHATVLLLNRDKLSGLVHRHVNELIIHGDLSEPVQINPETSFINLFEPKGS